MIHSSLSGTTGGTVRFRQANTTGWIGAGTSAGSFQSGAYIETAARGATWSAGDHWIPFRLPTDIFDSGHRQARTFKFTVLSGTAKGSAAFAANAGVDGLIVQY